jgi:hypothetical protein
MIVWCPLILLAYVPFPSGTSKVSHFAACAAPAHVKSAAPKRAVNAPDLRFRIDISPVLPAEKSACGH